MAEIETILETLQKALDNAEIDGTIYAEIRRPIVYYIINLLKEQESVEPIAMQRMDGNFSFFVPYFLCGNCRYELIGKDVMYCSHCGRSVKWE